MREVTGNQPPDELAGLDFAGLRDQAGRAARQPEFETVRRRSDALRTRRRLAIAGSALAAVLVLAAAGLAALRPRHEGLPPATGTTRSSDPRAGDLAGRSPTPPPSGGTEPYLRWMGAGDGQHLYAVVADCADCPERLMASQDGGRSWEQRRVYPHGGPARVFPLATRVYGPNTLVVTPSSIPAPPRADGPASSPASAAIAPGYEISVDGGVTWRERRRSDRTLPAAPAGSRIVPADLGPGDDHLDVLDPVSGELARLANQPPVLQPIPAELPAGVGVWVRGFDPATGRPAVSVSRDRGATWTTRVLPGEAAPSFERGRAGVGYLPRIATADGRTAYAVVGTDESPPRIYRSTDGGGSWRRANPDGPVSAAPRADEESYVTRGGAHVLAVQSDAGFRLLSSPDGGTYAPAQVTGLPRIDSLPVVVEQGHYLCRGADRIYRSGDGLRWEALPKP